MDLLKGIDLSTLTNLLQNKFVLFGIVGIAIVFMLRGSFKKH